MNKIDVILVSYNRPTMVKKAIESVLSQKDCEFTLYIMDDNSNIETKNVLSQYAKNYKNIVLYISDIKEEDRFKTIPGAKNINIALKMGTSEYISYLTDDCYYLPNRLKIMSDYLNENSNTYCVYGLQNVMDLDGRIKEIRGKDLGDVEYPHCKLDINQIMHRRSILEKTGYFEEDNIAQYMYQADGEFFMRIVKHFGSIKPINQFTDVNIDHPKRLTLIKMGFRGENHE